MHLPSQGRFRCDSASFSKSFPTTFLTGSQPDSRLRARFSRLPSLPETSDTSRRFGGPQDHPHSGQPVTNSGSPQTPLGPIMYRPTQWNLGQCSTYNYSFIVVKVYEPEPARGGGRSHWGGPKRDASLSSEMYSSASIEVCWFAHSVGSPGSSPELRVRCFMGVSLCRRGWRLAECGPGRPSPVPPAPGDSAGNAGSKSQLSIHTVSLSGVAKPHRSQQMRCQGLSKSNEDILIGREMPSVYGLPPGEAGQSRMSLCTGFLGRCPLAVSCPPAPSLRFLPSSLLN